MGRADYSDKPVEYNGTGVMCSDAALDSRAESPAQPRVQSEWPLSFAQQRLWFLEQLDPGKAAYNMPLVARLTGPFNLGAFQRAGQPRNQRHIEGRFAGVQLFQKPETLLRE